MQDLSPKIIYFRIFFGIGNIYVEIKHKKSNTWTLYVHEEKSSKNGIAG